MYLIILQGMHYLHKSPIKSHGSLTSNNVVIDGRWVAKVTDYGFSVFKEGIDKPAGSNRIDYVFTVLFSLLVSGIVTFQFFIALWLTVFSVSQGGHGIGKTGNLVLTFSRQGKHREFCCNMENF